jgi:hypothetical protein
MPVPARSIRRRLRALLLPALLLAIAPASAQEPFEIRAGERVVFIGNTFAERMQIFPHFEALLTARQPERRLTFRYLAWSGDEVALRPRPLNFGDIHTHLEEQRADVIFAAFGMNESYQGEDGLPRFRVELAALLGELKSRTYNGSTPPRIVLLSPIPHEQVARVPLDPAAHNADLARYTDAMREVAAAEGVRFVDLFEPMRPLISDPALGDLTINGIHLDNEGNRVAAALIARSLGWIPADASPTAAPPRNHERLSEAIRQKNELFFLRWRAVNGEYIYGRRKEPFGVVNFPEEMRQLEEMIQEREREIWRLAGGGASR